MDIQPNPMQPDYSGLRELALFAGAGGGLLASRQLGWRTVCAVEWDDYARNVLVARQNDGSLEAFPIWSDVQTFDGRPWRGIVDVISGGFPCQDISAAGKGAGIDGERSGMWKHFARIIGEVRPRYCFIENSPMLVTRGLERVLCDLTSMGYDAQWGCISAAEVGANHGRNRIWIVAHAIEQQSHGSRPQPEQDWIAKLTNTSGASIAVGNPNHNGQTPTKVGDSAYA
jgi:DNA (cytosine-5)-methyltransferase 1